jgi:hypothetical protein
MPLLTSGGVLSFLRVAGLATGVVLSFLWMPRIATGGVFVAFVNIHM